MWDEDEPKPIPKRIPPVALDPLGVAELQAYITELHAEIARVEAAIGRKQGHRTEADKVFRR